MLIDSGVNYICFLLPGQLSKYLLYLIAMDLQVTSILYFFLALVLAMSFHEAMHAFVAHWLGDTTAQEEGRLTLNPLAHIDLITTILLPTVLILMSLPPILAAKPVPFNPMRVKYGEFGAAMIGLAGPFTNLALAVVAGILLRSVGLDGPLALQSFLQMFVSVNIGLFVFNMLPIPPLDGSRLLYAVAPESIQKLMYRIESAGIFVVLMILFLLLPFLRPILNASYTFLYQLILL